MTRRNFFAGAASWLASLTGLTSFSACAAANSSDKRDARPLVVRRNATLSVRFCASCGKHHTDLMPVDVNGDYQWQCPKTGVQLLVFNMHSF